MTQNDEDSESARADEVRRAMRAKLLAATGRYWRTTPDGKLTLDNLTREEALSLAAACAAHGMDAIPDVHDKRTIRIYTGVTP